MTANFEIGSAFIVAMVVRRLGNMLMSRLNGTWIDMGSDRLTSQPLESEQHSKQSHDENDAAHV